MDNNKLVKDRECIHCKKFFECEGKPEKDKQCLQYEERKEDDVRR